MCCSFYIAGVFCGRGYVGFDGDAFCDSDLGMAAGIDNDDREDHDDCTDYN